MSLGSTSYFSSSECTAVRLMDTTSSWSPVNAMFFWPSPNVYLPGSTLSYASKSSWETCQAH